MEQHGEDRIKDTGTVSEPEVVYAHRSRRPSMRKGIPHPDGVNQSMEESAAAWRRQIDEFIAEGNRIYETGDTAARKDLARRMEAFMRENSTRERLMERIAISEQQIRRGEYMTADESMAHRYSGIRLQYIRAKICRKTEQHL